MTIQDVQKTVKSKSNNLETLLLRAKNRKQISFLKSLIKTENKEVCLKRKAILKETAAKYKMTVAKYQGLHAKAMLILTAFHTMHSMGCYRSMYLKLNGNTLKFASNNDLQNYAKSCKFKPTYGDISFTITTRELERIENIEGVWTVKLADNKAFWLEQQGKKQGAFINYVHGYCVGRSHGLTLEEATEIENVKISTQINLMQDNRRFVSAEIVHKETGACYTGINAFCQRLGLDINYGYNLGYLKSLNDRIANNYLSKIS